jgi:hypothetical protein
MAGAQNILVLVSPRLAEGTVYDAERYHRRSPPREARPRRRAGQALPALGYRVT